MDLIIAPRPRAEVERHLAVGRQVQGCGADRPDAVVSRCECAAATNGNSAQRRVAGEGSIGRHSHPAGAVKRTVHRQRSVIDRGRSGKHLGAFQHQHPAAILDQPASAADHSRDQRGARAAHRQVETIVVEIADRELVRVRIDPGVAAKRDHTGIAVVAAAIAQRAVVGHAGAAQRQRVPNRDIVGKLERAAGQVCNQAAAECVIAGGPERAIADGRSAAVGVVAAENQHTRRAAGIHEAAGAGNHAAVVAAAGHRQSVVADDAAAAIESADNDRVAIRVEDAAVDCQGRPIERQRVPQQQRSGLHHCPAQVGIGGSQRQDAGADLDEAAAVGDCSGQSQVSAGGIEVAGGSQIDITGPRLRGPTRGD